MERGYVKLWRKIEESAVFEDAHVFQLFCWLLMNVSRKPRQMLSGNTIPAGSMTTTFGALGERFGCSKSRIHHRLHLLENIGVISVSAERKFSVISICNWQTYQDQSEIDRTLAERKRNDSGTIAEHRTRKRESKKERNGACAEYSAEFESFWKAYPKRKGKKVGKDAAFAEWKNLQPTDRDLAITAATNYAAHCTSGDIYAKDAARFFKLNFWRDWIEAEEPEPDMTGRPLSSEQLRNLKPEDVRG